MEVFKAYSSLIDSISAEIQGYNKRPTKASSARLRKLSNELGKMGKALRKELLVEDKK